MISGLNGVFTNSSSLWQDFRVGWKNLHCKEYSVMSACKFAISLVTRFQQAVIHVVWLYRFFLSSCCHIPGCLYPLSIPAASCADFALFGFLLFTPSVSGASRQTRLNIQRLACVAPKTEYFSHRLFFALLHSTNCNHHEIEANLTGQVIE